MMNSADQPRQQDTDGHGNLSTRALHDFTAWFFRVCIEEMDDNLHQPATKRDIQQANLSILERLERFEMNLLGWFAAAERRMAMGGEHEQIV
jgi:hypothetical protein